MGVLIDGGQRLTQLGRCGWLVGGYERSEESVVDFGVEDLTPPVGNTCPASDSTSKMSRCE
ncbi:MAG TPA: hypothetical protein VLR88_11450, partial [Propionibacteriaceae bacterium]|nr:hypothetical protein [Propionibacteriaceae bacterium]